MQRLYFSFPFFLVRFFHSLFTCKIENTHTQRHTRIHTFVYFIHLHIDQTKVHTLPHNRMKTFCTNTHSFTNTTFSIEEYIQCGYVHYCCCCFYGITFFSAAASIVPQKTDITECDSQTLAKADLQRYFRVLIESAPYCVLTKRYSVAFASRHTQYL